MQRSRRSVKILSSTLIAGALFTAQEASAQIQSVVIVGERSADYSSGYSGGFDGYMGQFFGGSSIRSSGFSVPEAEAFAMIFGRWLGGSSVPNPHFTFNACSADPRISPQSREITKDDDSMLRLAAARQMLTSIIPNFINTKKDGLVIKIVFSDGSFESYRHTSMYSWQPIQNSFYPGTGVAGSAC